MNDTAYIAEFAENLWSKYIKPKVMNELQNDVRFYKAKVVTNLGDGRLIVQKPYDSQVMIACSSALRAVSVGTLVTVLVFGNGNAMNHIAVSAAGMKDISLGSDDYVVESGSSKTGLDTTVFNANNSNCYWKKWSSGELELYGECQFDDLISTDTQAIGGYVTSAMFPCWGAWPVPFITPPAVTCNLIVNESDRAANYIDLVRCFPPSSMFYNQTGPYYRAWSDTNNTYYYGGDYPVLVFRAVGRWK